MTAKNPRSQSEVKIPNGSYFEPYTPVAGPIISPALNKKLRYACFYLSADAAVTFKDGKGNAVAAYPFSKGRHDILVTEVTVVSAGILALVHDGQIMTTEEE